jgi:hypothetical protein
MVAELARHPHFQPGGLRLLWRPAGLASHFCRQKSYYRRQMAPNRGSFLG